MTTLTASLEERIDDATLQTVRDQVATNGGGSMPESTAPMPKGRISSFLENTVAKRLGHRHLVRLAANRGRVTEAWRDVPDRMHRVANQTKLMLELVDDFRAGRYREIPWHSIAIGAAAMLYSASPADIVPDFLPGVGFLDDITIAAFAARLIRKDLIAYCRSKGYPVEEYFASA